MIALRILMLASAALALSTGVSPCAHAQAGSEDLPPELIQFVGRRASCLEWSRKAIDPAAQTDDIKSILLSLKCGNIAFDEHVLRQKYADNPNLLAALDATWTRVVQRLSPRVAVPPAPDR